MTRQYSVIIPLYNKEKSIGATLGSVVRQTQSPSQIVVIDDQSTDNSYSLLNSHYILDREGIELYQNEKNIGKAATINWAIQNKVRYPFVLIIDADTFLDKNFVEEAMKGFKHRRVKGTGGQVYPAKTESLIEKTRAVEYIVSPPIKWVQNKLHGVWVLSGCASIWRTFFLRQNPMPDSLVEDMYITWIAQSCRDYKNRPFEVRFLSSARCFTEEPNTFKDLVAQLHRWYSNRIVFLKLFMKARRGLKATCLGALGSFLFGTSLLVYEIVTRDYLAMAVSTGIWDAFWTSLIVYENRKFKLPFKDLVLGLLGYFGYLFLVSGIFIKCLIKPKKKW